MEGARGRGERWRGEEKERAAGGMGARLCICNMHRNAPAYDVQHTMAHGVSICRIQWHMQTHTCWEAAEVVEIPVIVLATYGSQGSSSARSHPAVQAVQAVHIIEATQAVHEAIRQRSACQAVGVKPSKRMKPSGSA